MAWRRTGEKPLSEPMLALVTDAYMRHSASMSYHNVNQIVLSRKAFIWYCVGENKFEGKYACFRNSSFASLKRKCYNFEEIFATGRTGSFHFDNFRCSQWRKFLQNDDISVSEIHWDDCHDSISADDDSGPENLSKSHFTRLVTHSPRVFASYTCSRAKGNGTPQSDTTEWNPNSSPIGWPMRQFCNQNWWAFMGQALCENVFD